jgi:hypothetical protein
MQIKNIDLFDVIIYLNLSKQIKGTMKQNLERSASLEESKKKPVRANNEKNIAF